MGQMNDKEHRENSNAVTYLLGNCGLWKSIKIFTFPPNITTVNSSDYSVMILYGCISFWDI